MRQCNFGKALQAQGYVAVEKCAKAPAYTECVTDGEIAAVKEAEADKARLEAEAREAEQRSHQS